MKELTYCPSDKASSEKKQTLGAQMSSFLPDSKTGIEKDGRRQSSQESPMSSGPELGEAVPMSYLVSPTLHRIMYASLLYNTGVITLVITLVPHPAKYTNKSSIEFNGLTESKVRTRF